MIKATLFDCDGTIYDTRGAGDVGDRAALERTFKELSINAPLPSLTEIRGMMGKQYDEFYRSVIPKEYFNNAHPLVSKYAKVEVIKLVRIKKGKLYSGVIDTLNILKKKGLKLGFVSNGHKSYLSAVSETYALDKIFDIILSVEEVDGDKGDLLKFELAKLKVQPNEAIMVGDRQSDVDAAMKAGCRVVACSYGYGSAGELKGADFIIDKFEELVSVIENEGG